MRPMLKRIYLSNATFFQQKARAMEELAGSATDPTVKRSYLMLAADYAELAKTYERLTH
jgi:hypothetical protein